MLPRLFLAVAPFLLVADALVLPSVHQRADGILEVGCGAAAEVTKTVTVTNLGLPGPQTTPAPGHTEQVKPVGTLSSVGSGNAPVIALPKTTSKAQAGASTVKPTLVTSVKTTAASGKAPAVVQSTAKPAQTGGVAAPSSGYKNILYFTNWYVSCES